MIFDGINFRRNNVYGFRMAVEGDIDGNDNPAPVNHVVIVKIKDCETHDEIRNGRVFTVYNPKGVKQAVKLGYGLTNMGYGPWRRHGITDVAKKVPGLGILHKGDNYDSCQIFLVKNGRVYTTNTKQKVEA